MPRARIPIGRCRRRRRRRCRCASVGRCRCRRWRQESHRGGAGRADQAAAMRRPRRRHDDDEELGAGERENERREWAAGGSQTRVAHSSRRFALPQAKPRTQAHQARRTCELTHLESHSGHQASNERMRANELGEEAHSSRDSTPRQGLTWTRLLCGAGRISTNFKNNLHSQHSKHGSRVRKAAMQIY